MGAGIEESDLDLNRFQCCGDEDLYPFGCPTCGRPMVLCCECETLFSDPSDLAEQFTGINNFDPSGPIFACPQCGRPFTFHFVRDGRHKVDRGDWLAAGLGNLLRDGAGTSGI